jgi:hypothetical protein
MAAGNKISDTTQQYQYSYPFVTPSGHEFSFYDTPENQRLVIRHASGSSIEFKADGSIFIKAVGDLHTQSGVVASSDGSSGGSDVTTHRIDTDYAWEVAGKLTIKCSELDFEIGSSGRILSGSDLIITANNLIEKATESISLEGTKSIYMDTKEMRERIVSRRSEAGTMEDKGKGGVNIMNVYGNTIIQNDDPNGGITISSKGYLNLVCGQERVDITGLWTDMPSLEARGTFTNVVYAGVGSALPPSGIPGSYYESIEMNKDVIIGMEETKEVGMSSITNVGIDHITNVGALYMVNATKIFLN